MLRLPFSIGPRVATAGRRVLTTAVAAIGLSALAGCPGYTNIVVVNLQNPQPRVGEDTELTLEVLANWFRTPTFYYRALRGRIVGLNGETAPQGGYVRAGVKVRYYAPYTSNYPTPQGLQPGDTIEVLAQDGQFITRKNIQVNLFGSTVVFATQQGTAQNGTLTYAIDSGSGQMQSQPQPLKNLRGEDIMGTSPTISPNGERIAYVFYPGDGRSQIMMRDASGQVLALTSNSRGLNLDPAWSPDGQFLLFAGNHETPDGTFDIYMMNVDQGQGGRAVTRLTNNTWDDRHPAWNPVSTSPENRAIAVVARKNNFQSPGGLTQSWNIFLMDRRGQYTQEVSALQGDGDNWAAEPAWRPDGNALAYTRYGPVNNFQSSASKFQRIFVQELQTSTTLTPLNAGSTDPNAKECSPVWSSDRNNNLYFLRTEGAFQGFARIFQTLYLPGSTTSSAQPQLVAPFQSLSLPLTTVGGTNRQISGYHPFDWR